MNRLLIAAALASIIFIACAWGLYAFVSLKLGASPPCEASNTCNHWR